MLTAYRCDSLDDLIKLLKACETLGLYYKVEKCIEIDQNGTPNDFWRLEIDRI